MNKKTKIVSISLFAATIITIPSIVAPCIITSNAKKVVSDAKYVFDGQTFNTRQEALKKATMDADSYIKKTEIPENWSLNVNNELVTFNNQKDLYKYLDQFIEQKTYTSYTNDFQTDSTLGSLDPNELSKMNFDSNITKTKIYRGKNNSIYTSELDAKKSYLQIHEVYYFNGIFFRSKEELAVWLDKNFKNYNNTSSSKIYKIVLKDSNGGVSTPIDVEDLKQEYKANINNPRFIPNEINNFVKTSAIPYIDYYDKDTNQEIFVSEGESIDNIINYFDPSYVTINSNQGKGNYIIDTSTEEDSSVSLFGPYYAKAGTEILQINDRSKWRQVAGTDYATVTEIEQKALISNFMNLILATQTNESDLSKLPIYNIPDIQDTIDSYFCNLSRSLPKIYNSVRNLYDTMRQGKKYGEFLKTPILFLHTIDQMIYYNVEQKYIDLTREFYTTICKYFDNVLYSTVPDAFLYNVNNHKKFSFLELFGINQLNLDLNYDVDSKVGEIIYEFPDLFEFINFLCKMQLLLTKLNTLYKIDFSFDFIKKTLDLNLNKKFENEYKLVWDILNSNSINEFIDNLSIFYEQNEISSPTPNYYYNNFISQRNTSNIAKIIIEYWINNERTIKKFNLSEDNIKLLNKISVFSPLNAAFCNPIGKYQVINTNFLINYYKQHNNDVNPILFSRMIFFMEYWNNEKSLSAALLNAKGNSDEEKTADLLFNILYNDKNIIKYLQRDSNTVLNRKNIAYCGLISSTDYFDLPPWNNNQQSLRKDDSKEDSKEDSKKDYSKIRNLLKNTKSFLYQIGNIVNNANTMDADDIVDATFNLLGTVFDSLSLFCPWFIIGSVICDLICGMYNIEKTSYIFETEDVKYIWNGGRKETYFFGIIPGNQTTIEDMKLLAPMQIIKPNNISGYYYDGKIYSDTDQVKTKQLNDIVNGRYSSKEFKKVYSLLPLNNSSQRVDHLYYNSSIDDLALAFSNHVKQMVMNDNIKNDSIVIPSAYKFGNFVYDSQISDKDNVNLVLNNIKPTLIAQTPILNPNDSKYANMPIFSDTDAIDNSIATYKLPGKSWTADGGYYTNPNKNFIIVDQNPINNPSNNNSPYDYKKVLEKQFINSFDVDSKEIDNKFLHSSNLYSEISSKIESNFCYVTYGKDKDQKIFLDKEKAYKWLMTEFDLQTHFIYKTLETYCYNNLIFNSYLDFSNWVYSNIKKEK